MNRYDKMLEIDIEDVEMIMGDEFKFFKKIVQSSYCSHCTPRGTVTIVNYKAYLNDLNDILLKGQCNKCGHPINKYIETGEQRKFVEIAEHIRRIKTMKI